MQTFVPVEIAAEKFVNRLSFAAESINAQTWHLGESVLAPVSAVHNCATVYLLSVHEPHYSVCAVNVARLPTGRDQSDGIRLDKPSTYKLVARTDDYYRFHENLNVSDLDKLSPKDLACLAQHSDVRLTVIFKHASVVENYRLLPS
jgi:hypothetical protein